MDTKFRTGINDDGRLFVEITSSRTGGQLETWTGSRDEMDDALAFIEANAEPDDVTKIGNALRVSNNLSA
jgi:hypothetical protein